VCSGVKVGEGGGPVKEGYKRRDEQDGYDHRYPGSPDNIVQLRHVHEDSVEYPGGGVCKKPSQLAQDQEQSSSSPLHV